MFEREIRVVNYYDSDGNICGSEIQVRSRLVDIVLGLFSFGAWSDWTLLPATDITV